MRYRFRDFQLDPAARELRREDELVALPASALDCLIHLIEHRDRAVGRDELIASVWGRVDVADSLLAQTILRVRRTLGDSGSDGSIRTVARFGYRWVEPTEVESDESPAGDSPATVGVNAPVTNPVHQIASPPIEDIAAHATVTAPPSTPTRPRRPRGLWPAAGVGVLALLAVLLWSLLRVGDTSVGHNGSARHLSVLPANVPDLAGWEWLRLGLMDLIGNRLRQGGLAVLPSEQVLAGLADAPTTGAPGWRVEPFASYRDGEWRVRLRAQRPDGADEEVEAQSADVLGAARSAADLLLIRLGRTPPDGTVSTRSLALEELLQRTKTAILSDQFDLARHLIERAPEAVRAEPEIELRLAQIDQGRGRNSTAVEQLRALLDRLPAQADPALRGRILLTLGTSLFRLGELAPAHQAFDDAIALLQDANDPIALAGAFGSRAAIASLAEDYESAAADLGRARVEMEAGGDALGLGQIDMNLGLVQSRNYRPALALPLLRSAEERIALLGAREELAYVRYAQIGPQLQLLDLAAAQATVAKFWPPEAHTGNERLRWRLTLSRVMVLQAAGQLSEADALLAEIQARADPAEDAAVCSNARALTVVSAAARGQYGPAAALAQAAMGAELEREHADLQLSTWVLRLRALRASGQRDTARSEIVALREWVQRHGNPWRQLLAQLADAELAWSDGDRDTALAGFASAFDAARQLGIPEDLTFVAEPYVQALLASGHLDRATTVVGSVASWADQEPRAAWVQAEVYRAQGRSDAWQRSLERAIDLAGERVLPTVRLD